MKLLVGLVVFLALLGACQPGEENPGTNPYTQKAKPEVPTDFPPPPLEQEANNPRSQAQVELGRELFYDPILSRDSSTSCGSCHMPSKGFADSEAISPGFQGRKGFRNAPTLTNVVYRENMLLDGGSADLFFQAIVPFEDSNEFNLPIAEALERLRQNTHYAEEFEKVFGQGPSSFTLTRALVAFEEMLISGNAPLDRFRRGDSAALSASAVRGKALFESDSLACKQCHSGFNFRKEGFENNGLYRNYEDPGRYRITLQEKDRGKFIVPTLRNVAETAPYMHDGSLPSLRAVIDHYEAGGKGHPNQSTLIGGFSLSPRETEDLLAFLRSLTDHEFLNNPQFQNPHQ